MSTNTPMIEVANLSKHYGHVEAVHNISFRISKGEIVGLLGPNGAGKTTTMRMLTTFLPPTSGTATIAGFDIIRQPDEVRKSLGYLPESPPIYPEMRVRDFLKFVAVIKGVEKKRINEAVESVLQSCSLLDVRHRLCSQLSKGFRQRVGIAQAIIHEPKVIILDEPTSGLDPAQIIEMREVIKKLSLNHTVILSTHILSEVIASCSRVIIIAKGRVVVEGGLEELTNEHSLEKRFLEAVASNSLEGVEVIA